MNFPFLTIWILTDASLIILYLICQYSPSELLQPWPFLGLLISVSLLASIVYRHVSPRCSQHLTQASQLNMPVQQYPLSSLKRHDKILTSSRPNAACLLVLGTFVLGLWTFFGGVVFMTSGMALSDDPGGVPVLAALLILSFDAVYLTLGLYLLFNTLKAAWVVVRGPERTTTDVEGSGSEAQMETGDEMTGLMEA